MAPVRDGLRIENNFRAEVVANALSLIGRGADAGAGRSFCRATHDQFCVALHTHDDLTKATSIPHPHAASTVKMVRYAAELDNAKSARARGSYLRVSFKNTRETAQAINGWKLERALTYLGNVLEHKEAVPMRRYAGSTGRCAQGECSPAPETEYAPANIS